ncbi:MAG: hypothetical protein H6942_12590 [Candidatus Accumulibacter sp.]|uniref:hypothetical protein n=1 Tax=Accumulibacter sp. TaxID=2053492 RepID=UPI0019F53132|nr:hypothetical protein [Accumulibacter sp.]MBE2260026.1 hypothetical protein [Paracoccaceae bacterium]MCB1941268.1 hypothetical protein [Accumulibacter sp.]MCP5249350.1 hypothetical protein [Accumulibacter sp.]
MNERRLIYLSGHQVSVFRWHAGVLTDEGSFDDSEAGQRAFSGHLLRRSKSIFSLLANVSEEGFQIETIPFLRGDDRRAIIARKLGQLFFNARLTTSLSLGHQKSRRKDERVMLAALTNNELFAPWLNAIASAEVALAGIYSLPLLGPLLLKKLGVPPEPCLLLSIQDQSVRQSYLENGELHFSRLTPLQNSSIGGIAQTFSAEAAKLQQYLVSQRLIGRKQPIVAYLLAHANARKAIESTCRDSDTLSFTILDIEDCARTCSLKALPANTHCEPLFLHLLATDPPRYQFANDEQRHDYHLWLLHSALRGSGAVLLMGCLLLSGKQIVDAHRLNQEVAALGAETGLARQRYAEIVKTFPPIPTTNEALRQVINRYVELEKSSASPDFLYREISHALDRVPSVELESIDWRVGDPQPARGAATAGAANPEPRPADGETAVFQGTLRLGSDSNPRQVLAVFNRLVDALKSNPKLQVEVQQQPFDVQSGKSLKGGDAAVDEQQPRAFKVQVRRAAG